MKTLTVILGTLLGFMVGASVETLAFAMTGRVFPPIATLGCGLVGFGLGLAFATRTRKPRRPIDPARYPNRIVSISRRPR